MVMKKKKKEALAASSETLLEIVFHAIYHLHAWLYNA
jgi:hypothetical protein